MLANELVDEAGLRWLAAELDADPDFRSMCWVDSVRGVELMTAALAAAARRPVDVCVEVGMPGGRTGCRGPTRSTRWRARPRRRRGCGWSASRATRRRSGTTSTPTRWPRSPATCTRCGPRWCGWPALFETDDVIVTAGGSTYFDAVADVLTGWPAGLSVRTDPAQRRAT